MLPPRPHTVKHAAGVITTVCVAVLLAGVASAQTAPRDEDLAPYAATPLPATIITREMIAQSGARSLREVVLAYVPGLSALQAPSEQSVAMRGVYGEMQQHILVLVDGHVLNARATGAAPLDVGLTLDNVDRIEVERGPASTWGVGALTATIHVHTRTAAAATAPDVRVGLGSMGQRRLSFVSSGTAAGSGTYLAWGAVAASSGQALPSDTLPRYARTPGSAFVTADRLAAPASHDVGVRYERGPLAVFATHRTGHSSEPLSGGGVTGQTYTASSFATIDGVEPGMATSTSSVGVSVDAPLTTSSALSVRAYADARGFTRHAIVDPVVGAHTVAHWNEWDAGLRTTVSGQQTSGAGARDWTVGAQWDRARVEDSALYAGTGGALASVGGALLPRGREEVGSLFGEVSQAIGTRVVATALLRADLKARQDGRILHEATPRLGVSVRPHARWNVSASWARGYADAPYWYRLAALPGQQGTPDLTPAVLQALQVSPAVQVRRGLTVRVNLFSTSLRHALARQAADVDGATTFNSTGRVRVSGFEPEVSWLRPGVRVIAHLTTLGAGDAAGYPVTDGRVHHVPSRGWSVVTAFQPLQGLGSDAWFDLSARYVGAQAAPVAVPVGVLLYAEPDRTVNGVVLVGIGLRSALTVRGRRYAIDAHVQNLLGRVYAQGGTVAYPYPQAGRSLLLTVGTGR